MLLLLLAGTIFMSGCASADREIASTLELLYGDRLVDTTSFAQEGTAGLGIRLASGEPTGTEPFIALAVLTDAYPEMGRYDVSYYVPSTPQADTLHIYRWNSANQRLEWQKGDYSGSLGTAFPMGEVAGVSADMIHDIVEGAEPIPEFLPTPPDQ